jgi:hypothetical protein
MITIPPNIVGLFPAKRLEVDAQKRELSLVGIFPALSFSRFPTAPVQLTTFAMVNGGRGEGTLELAVYSLGITDADFPGGLIYRQRKWTRFLDDPNFTTTLDLRVTDLIFLAPGEHLFVLSFDGKPITDRRMSVVKGKALP